MTFAAAWELMDSWRWRNLWKKAALSSRKVSTATIFPEFGLTPGVTVEHPAELFVRGSVLRGRFSDMKSPIGYGFEGTDLPVYFNQDPVLNTGGGRGGAGGGAINGGEGQNVTPNAIPVHISPWNEEEGGAVANSNERPSAADIAAVNAGAGRGGRGRGGRGGGAAADAGGAGAAGGGQGGGFGGRGGGAGGLAARVVMRFPANPADMLLSGTLANGEGLANRAAIIDSPVGKGHVVMFALRPSGDGRRREHTRWDSTRL